MAQIREFTSTNASYFILDGVKYPKSYEAIDDSSLNENRLKVIPIGRTGEQLLYSTHYKNVRVNGNSFTSLEQAISAINEVVFSKGGGSGDGGTGIQSIQEGDNITIDNTDPLNPIVSATGGGAGGDFMTKNSGNEITYEWMLNMGNANFYLESDAISFSGETGENILFNVNVGGRGIYLDYNNTQSIRLDAYEGLGAMDLSTLNGGSWNIKPINGYKSNLYLPATENIEDVDELYRTIVISVNNQFADDHGNINVGESYYLTETLTGGTWIDGKPLYKKTQLTSDPIPSDIETRLQDEIVGTYTVYHYTKTTD